jgi:hypothetical protein
MKYISLLVLLATASLYPMEDQNQGTFQPKSLVQCNFDVYARIIQANPTVLTQQVLDGKIAVDLATRVADYLLFTAPLSYENRVAFARSWNAIATMYAIADQQKFTTFLNHAADAKFQPLLDFAQREFNELEMEAIRSAFNHMLYVERAYNHINNEALFKLAAALKLYDVASMLAGKYFDLEMLVEYFQNYTKQDPAFFAMLLEPYTSMPLSTDALVQLTSLQDRLEYNNPALLKTLLEIFPTLITAEMCERYQRILAKAQDELRTLEALPTVKRSYVQFAWEYAQAWIDVVAMLKEKQKQQ